MVMVFYFIHRNDDSYFKELLYYRKGKRLINRVVPILPQVTSYLHNELYSLLVLVL